MAPICLPEADFQDLGLQNQPLLAVFLVLARYENHLGRFVPALETLIGKSGEGPRNLLLTGNPNDSYNQPGLLKEGQLNPVPKLKARCPLKVCGWSLRSIL